MVLIDIEPRNKPRTFLLLGSSRLLKASAGALK
jgi:hypothetical protein